MRSSFIAVALLACVALVGCKSSDRPVGSDQPELPPLQDSDFPDAIRLSNGTVNLIIVPSIGGRIMRYGYIGQPNVLWNNPKVGALREQAATRPSMNVNYGGDKAWPWPQDQWPLLIGRTYPPPAEADQRPYKSRLIGSHGVRLESPPIPSHGARIVREIKLEPQGTRVTIVTRLEPAPTDNPPPSELAAWAVTQLHGQAKLYARLLPGGTAQPMQAGSTSMGVATTRPVSGRVVAIDSKDTKASKLGLDADMLAATYGPVLFVQHSPTTSPRGTGYRRSERAQIFVQQGDAVADKKDANKTTVTPPRYVELEFTSPRRDLAQGQVPELRVTWDLHHTQGEPWTDKTVAVFLTADPASQPVAPADPLNRMPPMGVP